MAHTKCPAGHIMWNGDGKPDVQAYRINYFSGFDQRHPEYKLHTDGGFPAIYDTYEEDGHPEEEYDLWYCDECKGLAIFTIDNRFRYDYVFSEPTEDDMNLFTDGWEEYYALRDDEYHDKFYDLCDNRTPWDVLSTYEFKRIYRVSPDKELIFAFLTKNSQLEFVYRLSIIHDFEKER